MKKSQKMDNDEWEEMGVKAASVIRFNLSDEVIHNVVNEEKA